ncbi:WD40-repeat-containing domain protein [Suillus ampliporus]|nr:WD40-repeat-containing domain protein [Suillus ampliporus]
MDPQKTTTIHGTPRKAACRRLVLDGFLLLPVVDSIMSTATSHDNASPKPPSHRNTLDGHPLRAWCVAAFPDNERVVSASDDDTVVVWKFRTKEKERSWSHKGATTVAVSHDGNKVVSGGRDCSLKLWDAMSGQPLAGPWKVHEQRVWSVSWSPNGNRIASCSADSILIIWNAHSGEPIFKPLPTEQNEVYAVAYSPNGEKVATGGQDFTIKIWDAHTGDLQATLRGHAMSVSSVAWTKDGSNVISGSVDGIVRIWDIIKEKGVCHEIQAHSHGVNYIAVSGHVFATATPDHAYLWSLKTRQRVCGPFELSKSDEANCVALSDDENTISACTEKGRVYTWNIGKITSAIQKGDAEDFSDIGDIDVTGSPDHDDFLPNDFFGSSAVSFSNDWLPRCVLVYHVILYRAKLYHARPSPAGCGCFSTRLMKTTTDDRPPLEPMKMPLGGAHSW